MARKIGPLDFSKAINEVLTKYGDEVYDVMEETIDSVAEEAKDRLRSVNHFRKEASGKYAGSWVNEKLVGKPLTVNHAVHNEEHYRLTHLLEKGHTIKNGTGRSFGTAAAFPHIAPVNDWANKEVVAKIERKLKQ